MKPDDDDELLLENLRRVTAQADPVPAHVVEAAQAALETLDIDGELAELIADSSASAPELMFDTVRRSPVDVSSERLLSFSSGAVQIELEISHRDDGITLLGQLTGAANTGCVLDHGDGRREPVELDDLG